VKRYLSAIMHGRSACVALVLYMSIGTISSAAQEAQSVFLEELTWIELRDQVAAGKTIAMIPVGATEQSGPDVALGKHNARVKLLSEKIAVVLGNAIVAPVIAYVPEGDVNPATSHMKYPGTLTIPRDVFQKTLEYAARSLKNAGFRDIVFLGDHGGYQADLQVVAEKLNREWLGTTVRVHAVDEYYEASSTGFARILRAKGFSEAEIGNHAGLADVSLLLATDPSMVRQGRLVADAGHATSEGVIGNAGRASAGLGQLGVDEVVTQTVAAIRKQTARH